MVLTLLSTSHGFSPMQHTKTSFPSSSRLAMTNENMDNLIMVVGSANQDLTSTTDVLPILGETVMGKEFSTACGGKGANQAVAAAALGLAPVAMVCRVGDDVFGENLLGNFGRFAESKSFL